MKKVIGIYHKDCTDGTTAAAVLLRRFPHAQVFPLAHDYTNENMAPILTQVTEETEVYVLDCELGVEECLEVGATVVMLDHHASVRERFTQLEASHDRFTYIYEEDKSGASLAWAYFFPQEDVPRLVLHVEDNDLWLRRLDPESRYVGHALSMLRNMPEQVCVRLNEPIEHVYTEGNYIDAYVSIQVAHAQKTPPIRLRIGEHVVAAYNITEHESVCGNLLARETGKTSVMFTIRGDVVKFSFRSVAGQVPSALDLAAALGGGGHELSAGARIPLADFLTQVVIVQ